MRRLGRALQQQWWDDHRLYHHSRVNQSLHLLSSLTFVSVYVLLFTDPVVAVLLGWFFAMLIRQVGHFFFEPKVFDATSNTSHEERESMKIGFNLRRKIVLLSIFASLPLLLVFTPGSFGLESGSGFGAHLEVLSRLWLGLAIGAVLFRMGQLAVRGEPETALVWGIKILTDPFHDIVMYWKAPFFLLRGQQFDYEEYAEEPRAA